MQQSRARLQIAKQAQGHEKTPANGKPAFTFFHL
jgi:hypothetical protein